MNSNVPCHHPGCDSNADELAFDTVMKVNIAFCENHGQYWFRQSHIEHKDE